MFAFDNREAADSGTDEDAGPFRQFGSDRQAGLLHREVGCCDGIMNERIHLPEVFLFESLQRIEVLDLGGDFRGKLCRVEL